MTGHVDLATSTTDVTLPSTGYANQWQPYNRIRVGCQLATIAKTTDTGAVRDALVAKGLAIVAAYEDAGGPVLTVEAGRVGGRCCCSAPTAARSSSSRLHRP